MKKILLSLISVFVYSTVNAADISYGISVSVMNVDGSGTETQEGDSEKNNGSANNTVPVGSLFVENNFGSFSLGLDYIPFKADVSSKTKTRLDTNSAADAPAEADTGTNKAQAEIKNHVTLYAIYPFSNNLYLKAGVAHMDVETTESLATGSKYGDDDVFGGQIGIGIQNDKFRFGIEYTDYETVSVSSQTGNKVEADLDTTAVKLSYSF